MTPMEAGKLVITALANFPELAERDMAPTAALWHDALKDLPYTVVHKALLKVLCTSNRFPKLSDIREAVAEILHPLPSSAAAWEEVCNMQRKYSFRMSGEGIQTLSPLTQRVVRAISLYDLYHNDGDSTQRTFFKLYEGMYQEQKKMAMMPDGISQLLNQRSILLLGGEANANTTA